MIALSALAGSKRYVAYADARLPVAHLSSPRDNLYELIQNPFRKERVLFSLSVLLQRKSRDANASLLLSYLREFALALALGTGNHDDPYKACQDHTAAGAAGQPHPPGKSGNGCRNGSQGNDFFPFRHAINTVIHPQALFCIRRGGLHEARIPLMRALLLKLLTDDTGLPVVVLVISPIAVLMAHLALIITDITVGVTGVVIFMLQHFVGLATADTGLPVAMLAGIIPIVILVGMSQGGNQNVAAVHANLILVLPCFLAGDMFSHIVLHAADLASMPVTGLIPFPGAGEVMGGLPNSAAGVTGGVASVIIAMGAGFFSATNVALAGMAGNA